MMTQEEKDGVIWWAIDDALKKASSGFINYESMAREHITELVNEIKNALDRNSLEIVEKVQNEKAIYCLWLGLISSRLWCWCYHGRSKYL
jgi:hypothetical protein